jgi:hypothetical protein
MELYDSAHIRKRLEDEFPISAALKTGFCWDELFEHEDKQNQVLRMTGRNASAIMTRSFPELV